MDENFSNYYKLQIAHDLITFLIHLQVDDLPPRLQVERTNMILEAWEKRLDTKLEELAETNLKNICEIDEIELDIAKILSDVHRIEPDAIRKEFKVEARHSILRSFEDHPKS